MGYFCFKCQSAQDISDPVRVGRRDTCPKCQSDLHACLNCTHYDPQAYNGCREPQAERVVDKDRSNFCDFFTYRAGTPKGAKPGAEKNSRMSKLDDLFKK